VEKRKRYKSESKEKGRGEIKQISRKKKGGYSLIRRLAGRTKGRGEKRMQNLSLQFMKKKEETPYKPILGKREYLSTERKIPEKKRGERGKSFTFVSERGVREPLPEMEGRGGRGKNSPLK